MAENSIEGRKSLDIEIIKARDIQVPVRPVEDFLTPELLKARSAFLAGRDISRDDLARLVIASAEGGGGNGNCNVC